MSKKTNSKPKQPKRPVRKPAKTPPAPKPPVAPVPVPAPALAEVAPRPPISPASIRDVRDRMVQLRALVALGGKSDIDAVPHRLDDLAAQLSEIADAA